jgi:hypothetical protein
MRVGWRFGGPSRKCPCPGEARPLAALERVVGVGGIFFKAKDSKKLEAWYRETLGLPGDENGEVMLLTKGDPGPGIVWLSMASSR